MMRLHVIDRPVDMEQLRQLTQSLIAAWFPVDGQIIIVRGKRTLCVGQAWPLAGQELRRLRERFNEGFEQ